MQSPAIPHVPILIDELDDLKHGARLLIKHIRPDWELEKLQFKLFTDGITNKLVGVFNDLCPDDDGVMVRIYGKNTDQIVDRKAEFENFKFLYQAGHAPDLYATFDNGMAYKYIHGETLTTTTVRDPNVYRLVAKTMARFHKLNDRKTSDSGVSELWNKMEQFAGLIPEKFSSPATNLRFQKIFTGGVVSLKAEIETLKTAFGVIDCPVVFSHNDLLLKNIIVQRDDEGRPVNAVFIDYEYSMLNYQPFDIINHFIEFTGIELDFSLYPNDELQLDWLTSYFEEYLGETLDQNDQRVITLKSQVDIFAITSHLLWAFWGLVQAEFSVIDFDYLGYAEIRFRHYINLKQLIGR